MAMVAILVGLSWGMLLVAVSFGLWGSCVGVRALCRGAHAVAWGAAGVLVVAALLAWGSGLPVLESLVGVIDRRSLEGPVLSLILMAALATPLRGDAAYRDRSNTALLHLPALLLSSAALIRIAKPGASVLSADWVTPIRFSLAVCGGLAARALGQSLHGLASGIPRFQWPGAPAYGLTTLLVGSSALVSLRQRGTLWGGADPILRGGLAGAWLAWSAGWLAPDSPRLRAAVTAVAATLLALAAIKPA